VVIEIMRAMMAWIRFVLAKTHWFYCWQQRCNSVSIIPATPPIVLSLPQLALQDTGVCAVIMLTFNVGAFLSPTQCLGSHLIELIMAANFKTRGCIDKSNHGMDSYWCWGLSGTHWFYCLQQRCNSVRIIPATTPIVLSFPQQAFSFQ
jgi:hypothetical protein